MKTILFVINTMGIGGGEKAILELFTQLSHLHSWRKCLIFQAKLLQ